jgi:hypothetical protein
MLLLGLHLKKKTFNFTKSHLLLESVICHQLLGKPELVHFGDHLFYIEVAGLKAI